MSWSWLLLLLFPFVVAWGTRRRFALHRLNASARVALTIDDGPDPTTTPALLEALEKAGIHATFFCIGSRLVAHPALARAIVDAGHTLANHSFTHASTLALKSVRTATEDLQQAQNVLRDLGVSNTDFRAVAGVLSPPLLRAARRLGLRCVHWTASARDGGPFHVSVATALARLQRGLLPGGILVMHDRQGAPGAALIAPLAAAARSRGLTLTPL